MQRRVYLFVDTRRVVLHHDDNKSFKDLLCVQQVLMLLFFTIIFLKKKIEGFIFRDFNFEFVLLSKFWCQI